MTTTTTLLNDAGQRTANEEDSVLTLGVRLGGNRDTRIAWLDKYFNDHQLHKPTSSQYPLLIRVSHLNQVSPTITFATSLRRAGQKSWNKIFTAGGSKAFTAIVSSFRERSLG